MNLSPQGDPQQNEDQLRQALTNQMRHELQQALAEQQQQFEHQMAILREQYQQSVERTQQLEAQLEQARQAQQVSQAPQAPAPGMGEPTPSRAEEESTLECALRLFVESQMASQGPAVNKPTKILPQLPLYEGDRYGLAAWQDQVRNKMAMDYSNCTERAKLFAVWSRIGGKAAQQMTPWFKQHREDPATTCEKLLTHLEAIYGDPHEAVNAQRQVYALRQRNTPFQEFFAEFDRILQLAGGEAWPDSAKIGLLENALSRELSSQLIGLTTGVEPWSEYVSLVARVSNSMERQRMSSSQQNRDNNRSRGPNTRFHLNTRPANQAARVEEGVTHTAAANELMDWEPTGPARTALQRAKWVSDAEVNRRRQSRLCVRCGSSEHFIRRCPYQAARPANAMVAVPLLEGGPTHRPKPSSAPSPRAVEESENE